MTQVVETVTALTLAELRAKRDRATDADLVELRLDGVRDLHVAGALDGRSLPVVVTCRPAWEGGRFDGSEEERHRLLTQAVDSGAEFVDVEWRAGFRDSLLASGREAGGNGASPGRTRFVVSNHDFDGTPADLAARVRDMRTTGADIVKVAITAHALRDGIALKEVLEGKPGHVGIAMGSAGQFTRLWPAWVGSCWTYGGSAAPGQVGTHDLIHRYHVRRTSGQTTAYGVAGSPVGHSASPAMHNAAIAEHGLDAVYLPLETANGEDLFALADEMNLAGVSVTIPLKQALLTSDVVIDDLPRRIGALNTLKRTKKGWEGRNFDVAGFLMPLDRRTVRLRRRRAVVLGAGGAARATVWSLATHGAHVGIAARREEAARALASEFGVEAIAWPPPPGWDLLVNTTPVGMWPHVGDAPIDLENIGPLDGKLVYDLVYNPVETRLIKAARAAGAETIGGLEMLIGQACRQFEWWTGQRAPRAAMEQAAMEFLGEDRRERSGTPG
jgi:3-dehydroquinate dehydratase/shikimate dehydrogenase